MYSWVRANKCVRFELNASPLPQTSFDMSCGPLRLISHVVYDCPLLPEKGPTPTRSALTPDNMHNRNDTLMTRFTRHST